MTNSFILHDSQDENFRTPFGAVECGSSICLKLEINTSSYINHVRLHLVAEDGIERQLEMLEESKVFNKHVYVVNIKVPELPGLLWYYFKASIGGIDYYYGNNQNAYGGIGCIYSHIPVYYQITVYKRGATTPDWFKHAVMYQIFTDRFHRGQQNGKPIGIKKNSFLYGSWDDTPCYVKDCETGGILRWDFFGGNLQGIIEKLDYLEELGVTVIYLNPIFESPSNHKYDTSDYLNIDPMFGDNESFKELCARASEKGISIILDGVFSHTGSDSVYFNKYGNYPETGAYQSKNSPYYPWYRFKEYPDSYDCWWGIDNMPNVDEMNPSYRDFIIRGENSVLKHWMRLGAKGWRLDVADELPDAFIQEIREHMKKTDENSVLIGEVWEDASNKISYDIRRKYLMGEELDSVMNYPFRNNLIDFLLYRKSAGVLNSAFMSLKENYPIHCFYSSMNFVGTHDVPRILTILGEAPEENTLTGRQREYYTLKSEQKALGISRLKLMTMIQMTFPGVPCIYYGDEAGVEGYSDPLNRKTFPWGKEDRELTDWYKKMIDIRKSAEAFRTGEFIPLYAENDVYAYMRIISMNKDVFGKNARNAAAIIAVNRCKAFGAVLHLETGSRIKDGSFKDALTGKTLYAVNGYIDIELKPLQGIILLSEGNL
ncbi:MAG: glycoside hydrolase family 13 protein [Bacillota bacterium]